MLVPSLVYVFISLCGFRQPVRAFASLCALRGRGGVGRGRKRAVLRGKGTARTLALLGRSAGRRQAKQAVNSARPQLLRSSHASESRASCFLPLPAITLCCTIAVQVGPHICVFKTHVDVFDSWNPDTARKLQGLAEKHGGRRSARSVCKATGDGRAGRRAGGRRRRTGRHP